MADLATLGLRLNAEELRNTSRASASSLDQVTAAARGTKAALKEVEAAATSAGRAEQQRAAAVSASMQRQEREARQSQERQRAMAAMAGREQARAQMEALEQQFQHDQARVREDQARGFLTPQQAREAGRLNAIAYNDGMVQALDAANASGALRGKQGQQLYLEMAGGLKNVNAEAKKAGLGMGQLRESLASVAAQMTGMHPVFGRMANVVGSFAVGGGMMVAVLAGVAALGAAFQAIMKPINDAKKAAQEALDVVLQVERKGWNTELRQVGAGIFEAQDRQRTMQWRMDHSMEGSRMYEAAKREYEYLNRVIEAAETRRLQIVAEKHKEQVEDFKAAQKKREDAAKKAADAIVEAENKIRSAITESLNTVQGAYQFESLRAAGMDEHAALITRVTAELGKEGNSLERILFLTRTLKEAEDALWNSRELKQLDRPIAPATNPLLYQGTVSGGVPLPTAADLRKWADGFRPDAEAVMQDIWGEAIRGVQQAFGRGFDAIFRDGLGGFKTFGQSIVDVFRQTAAQIAGAMTVRALGLDKLLADLKKPDGVSSTGALGSFMSGGPFAAGIFSGVVMSLGNAISGILGHAEEARKAAELAMESYKKMTQAVDDWQQALRESFGNAMSRVDSEFMQLWKSNPDYQNLQYLRTPQEVIDFYNQMVQGGNIDPNAEYGWDARIRELIDRYKAAMQETAEEAAKAADAVRNDFAASLAQLWADLSGGGEIVRLQQQQQERMRAAQELYDAGTITRDMLLSLSDALNTQLQQAIAAVQARLDETNVSMTLEFGARGAALGGDTALAETIRYQMQMREEAQRIMEAFQQGAISEAQMVEYLRIINAEFAQFRENLEAAAAAAAEAAAEAERRGMEGLVSRSLRATGRGGQADEYDLFARQRQETYDARERTPEYRAFLELVQGQERVAFFRERLVQQQTEAIRQAAEAQIAALDEQIKTSQDHLQVAREQLSEQERTVSALQRLSDSLSQFSSQLTIGSLSPLSPTAKLAEARQQANAVLAAARGGDINAATAWTEIAQRLLEASRGVNASGLGYAVDFRMVQEQTAALQAQYGNRLTVEQQMLDQLQKQNDALAAQIDELRAARDQASAAAQAQIDAIQASASQANADMQAQIEAARANAERAEAELQRQLNEMSRAADNSGFSAYQTGVMVDTTRGMLTEIQNLHYYGVASVRTAIEQNAGVQISLLGAIRDVLQAGLGELVDGVDEVEAAVLTSGIETRQALEGIAVRVKA